MERRSNGVRRCGRATRRTPHRPMKPPVAAKASSQPCDSADQAVRFARAGIACFPRLALAQKGREWKDPGRSGRHPAARSGLEPAIKDGGPYDRDAMSAVQRPSHSLALAHASIGDLVDAAFSTRCRYWTVN